MPLQKHHKIIIGGVSSFVVISVIVLSIFMYFLFSRQNLYYTLLSQKIDNLQTDTQSKISDLSKSVLDTQQNLKNLSSQFGSIDNEITLLKASTSSDFSGIIESAIKSVVTVRTDLSQGSGFIIADGGYVITNEHVMEGASAAGIITYDGQLHQVILIGKNTNMDIALLKIDGTYSPISLGNSDEVNIGEKVIAIGNPLGLQFSVTEGIVSSTNREGENGIKAYIQTDAALNPGNSGGPLIDTSGKVIGINNFKISGSENIGFALESNYIKQVVNEIYQLKNGKDLI